LILVLVAAALFSFSGCGGGAPSDDSSSQAASAPAVTSGGGNDGGGASELEGAAATEGDRGRHGDSSSGSGSAATPGGSSSQVTKHGPKVAVPKGPQESAPTPQQRAEATVVSMTLTSPALQGGSDGASTLPSTYTCDGTDSWPQLDWKGVPSGTAELALLVMNLQPVNGKIFFDWALAGIDPELEGIEAGRLPKGAIAGRNSFGQTGYSICPGKGAEETYFFALYAVPKPLSTREGFDPAALREQLQQLSGNAGLMAASYARN